MDNTTSKDVFKMSIPIFVELLLQLLVGNIDQLMLSQYSQNSVAAIGNANQVINIIIIVLNAVSVAATILISQYLGAKDKAKISETCNVSLVIITTASILVTLGIMIFGRTLFVWLKVPDNIIDEACNYTYIVSSFILIQGLYMAFAAILRSFSLMKEVMIASTIMNVINIIGNAILINGLFGFPRLGITGAAISTDISKCIGLGIVIFIFLKKVDAQISVKYLKPFPFSTLKKLLFIGLPSGAEVFSYNLSQMCILKFVNIFGTAIIATKVYCSMLANIAYVYSMAISQTTQVIIGYLIGGDKIDKVSKRVWQTLAISMAVSLTITLIIYLNSDFIFSFFTDDKTIIELGKKVIFIEFFLEIGRSVNIVMTRCLVAVGDLKLPVIVCVLSAWSIGVGLGYYFGVHLGYGLVGIWIAMATDECLRAIIFAIRFKIGNWRNRVLISHT